MTALDDRALDEASEHETLAADPAPAADLAGLDAHAAQERLVAMMAGDPQDADGAVDATDAGDADAGDEAVGAATEDARPEADAPFEWTAADTAAHLRMLEALLFAASEPLAEKVIAERLPAGAAVKDLLATLGAQYENRGVNLKALGGRWAFVTAPDVSHVLTKEKVEPRRLSRAALETLAIIAYHQPCTRADIEDVRGVAVSKGSLDQLLEIGWVRLRGRRKDAPGRPVLYGTTPAFLEHFGLAAVGDLPGMADLKAAGLLDARLPPGFQVPTPRDADDDVDPDDAGEGAETEFAQDFMAEESDATDPDAER